jgi:hypothetical protein
MGAPHQAIEASRAITTTTQLWYRDEQEREASVSTDGDFRSSSKLWISNSALVEKEASKAPASVAVARRGLLSKGGLHATAAVRLISFSDMFTAVTIKLKG